jgi:hypothetical protein
MERRTLLMIRRIPMLVAAALLVLALAVPALAAPKSCTDNPNGCKTDTTTQHSGNSSANFNNTTTETQRGNTDAQGTQDTEITTTTCTGPSGKTLAPSHPQCS